MRVGERGRERNWNIVGFIATYLSETLHIAFGVCDLDIDLENKVKVKRSQNFDWSYLSGSFWYRRIKMFGVLLITPYL